MSSVQGLARRLSQTPTWVLALLAGLLAWGLLEFGYAPQVIHDDTSEDLLMALACQQGRCATGGVSTNIEGVEQGAFWVNLLAYLRARDFDVGEVHSLTLALSGASVGLWFAIVSFARDRRQAAAAAVLLATLLLMSRSLHVLWNPSLMALPPVLLCGLLLRLARAPSLGPALAVGAACALVVESHPVGLLVVPGAVISTSMLLPRNGRVWIALLGATALGGGLYLGMSWSAAVANVQAIDQRLPVIGLTGATIGGLASCGLLTGRASNWSQTRRQWLVVVSLCVPPLAALLWMLLTVEDSPAGPRYLLPALPAAVLFSLLLLDERPRMLAGLSIAAIVVSIATRVSTTGGVIPLTGLDLVRADFQSRGIGLDELWARMSGGSCKRIISSSAALGLGRSEPEDLPEEDIYRLFVRDGSIESFEAELSEERGQWRTISVPGGVVALGEVDTWVERTQGELCAVNSEGASEHCQPYDLSVGIDALRDPEGNPVPLERLDNVELSGFRESFPAETRRFRMRLPIEIGPGSETRRIIVDRTGTQSCPREQFIAIEGLESPTSLPAGLIELQQGEQPRRGTLVFERDVTGCPSEALELFPPCLLEADVNGSPLLNHFLEQSL